MSLFTELTLNEQASLSGGTTCYTPDKGYDKDKYKYPKQDKYKCPKQDKYKYPKQDKCEY